MHQKISCEIFSARGKYHKEQGKENEDSINVVTNDDYVFAILSDGAGSSKFAKDASLTTVKTVSDFCFNNSAEFFKEIEKTVSRMIFDIQTKLDKKAVEIGAKLSEMVCTLVVLCLEKSTNRYITIHIGDGLVALKNKCWEIISYPENGPTKQYTYFTNSPLVFKHLRINEGVYYIGNKFFISTDGFFENCCFTEQYISKINSNIPTESTDDVTYCKIDCHML